MKRLGKQNFIALLAFLEMMQQRFDECALVERLRHICISPLTNIQLLQAHIKRLKGRIVDSESHLGCLLGKILVRLFGPTVAGLSDSKQIPVALEPPTGPISNRLGSKLESEDLIDIANCFLDFDLISLSVCETAFRNVLTGRFNADDPTARPHATSYLQEITIAQKELSLIQNKRRQFHQDVLQNRFLVEYTGKSLSILAQMLKDSSMNEPVRNTFDNMLSKVRSVPGKIAVAAQHGSLDTEMRVALRHRWNKIREMCDYMEKKALLASDRALPSW